MGFAANAIMDVVAPPAPPRSSSASADDASAPSFQDHVDANDDRPQRHDQPHAKNEARTSSDTSTPSSADQTDTGARSASAQEDAKPDPNAHAAPIQLPVLLQLIANAAQAVLGAKAEPPAAAQQETAAASQTQNNVADPAAALAAATTTPNTTASKADAAQRTPQVKTAKGATGKTSAVTDDAKTAATQTATPAPQEANAPVATTPNVAPTISDGNAKNEDAKAQAIEAPQSGSARSTPLTTSRPHAPATAAPATPDLSAPKQQPEATQAKDHENAKASAPLEALKQAAQDLAPATPKAQTAPSTPPPAVTHAQLAEPIQQAASDTTAARAAPAAAQVGGEIIRRFNGHDTSFQLRLDPPELGRVDVRLDVSRDHRVTAVISADSPQALSDLARGARDLQQALQSAGLDLADDGLRFDLSSNGQGNSFAQAQAQQDQSNSRATNTAQAETSIAPEVTASRPLSIDSWRGSRVDLVA